MSSMYYIKAYYNKPDQQQPEIRRFTINIASENDAYTELQTKIASFHPNCQLQDIALQYNDEENERITFSSNEELRSAIALSNDTNTLKVFVTINQPASQQQQPQQQQQDTTNKTCHHGVTCDGCGGPVLGARYKCFVCPDYDLCESCSSAGIHSEHNMMKITNPNGHFPPPMGPFGPHPNGHFPPPMGPFGPHPSGHFPPPMGPFGHHPYGHSFRHHQHHGRHHRHSRSPPSPTPTNDFFQQVQSQIPQWLPNRENAAHLRAHVQQHLDSLKTNTQAHMQNSKQYLENVGKYLQQTLSPFGIDCDYHVDERPAANSTTEQSQQGDETATTTTTTTTTTEQQSTVTETIPPAEASATPQDPDLPQNDIQEQTTTTETNLSATSTETMPPTITNPLEKVIDDCMERMQAMGFIDVNGGLRELVRSKHGDINAVLDAINPRNYQS